MVYEDFKDLNRRTAADRILHDKAFNIPKNQKHDGYQHVNLIKDLDFHCVVLTLIVNMHGLFI